MLDKMKLNMRLSDGLSLVASGSVTQANNKLATANGGAMIDIGIDLSSYAGNDAGVTSYLLALYDSSKKRMQGFMGASGGGEALGASILTNGNMENWDDASNLTSWDKTEAGTSTVNREGVAQQEGTFACRFDVDASGNAVLISQVPVYVEGALFYYSGQWKSSVNGRQVYVRTDAQDDGGISRTSKGTLTLTTSYVEYTTYFTSNTNDNIFEIVGRRLASTDKDFSSYADAQSIKRLTDISTNGVHLHSTRGGTNRNVASLDSGFDLNDPSGYVYKLYKLY